MSDLTGVLIIGAKGAVATTLIAAGLMSRRNVLEFALPSEQDPNFDHLPLIPLSKMVFGGWDICHQSYRDAVEQHAVLPAEVRAIILDDLDKLHCARGISVQPNESPIHGAIDDERTVAHPERPLRILTDTVEREIERFKETTGVSHVVLIDLSSTATTPQDALFHHHLYAFEAALDQPAQELFGSMSAGMLYAYAGLKQSCSYINFTPSLTVDLPALHQLALKSGVPVCGKDGKTGQTLYKTAIAPMLKQRALKVRGWYSTNILGNRDGEVLDHIEHRKTKVESKRAALSEILGYDDFDHQVHIHYYKPRGDAKEAWDNIDIEGWFGVPMQVKINWLGSDSILAAPLVADLIRWMKYYSDQGASGVIPELASYFKSPLGTTQHDLFEQVNRLRKAHDPSIK